MKIENNVKKFIDWCAKEIGKWEEDNWNIELFNNFEDYKEIESPIEKILWCALKTALKLNYLEDYFNYSPQEKIGSYRVDFLISYYGKQENTHKRNAQFVIVECDSQEWHERTEKERRYEKKRDRFIQSQGFKVFHYTGAEIIKNPMSIAVEIISELTGQEKECLLVNSNEEVS